MDIKYFMRFANLELSQTRYLTHRDAQYLPSSSVIFLILSSFIASALKMNVMKLTMVYFAIPSVHMRLTYLVCSMITWV